MSLFAALLAAVPASAQQPEVSVAIRFGALRTDCYPACDHATEWLQSLVAEVRDTTGTLLAPSAIEFDWGVDYCNGLGYQRGFARGVGISELRVDGNLQKSGPDCCVACEFQSYEVGVHVHWGDAWIAAVPVRVPNIIIPTRHALRPNHPNPFNAATTITFDLTERRYVRLEVVDLQGHTVALLADRSFAAGTHRLTWSAEGLATGVYFCRLELRADGPRSTYVQLQRMLLLR